MTEVFKFADELGPAKIIHFYESSANLKVVLVVDNVDELREVRKLQAVAQAERLRLGGEGK